MSSKRIYVKDESFDPIYRPVSKKFALRSKVYPTALMVFGLLILITQVVVPLIYFKTAQEISKPVSSSVLGIASGFRDFEFEELSASSNTLGASTTVPEFFYLSVPKLGIDKALVEANAKSLNPDVALGHYRGSSLPGEVGNVFIYGHSVLPWFFNPKNYKTIFSTLDKLDIGDTVYIWYNNKRLSYQISAKKIVYPEEVNPLANVAPEFLNDSTVTLMTCVPPGTKLKRLLVIGTLQR